MLGGGSSSQNPDQTHSHNHTHNSFIAALRAGEGDAVVLPTGGPEEFPMVPLSLSDKEEDDDTTPPTSGGDNDLLEAIANRLLKYDEIPEFLQGNVYIQEGYRVGYTCCYASRSLFTLHNETINVWTHLIGFLGFFVFMIVLSVALDASPVEKLFLSIFFIAAQAQMLFSAIFHLFCCINSTAYVSLAKLDYSGITFMIVGSMYPVIYFGFACYETHMIVYLVVFTVFGAIGLAVSLLKVFSTARFLFVRTGFFLLFGFSGAAPVVHLSAIYGFVEYWVVLWKLFLMAFLYTAGAFIYSSRVPERWLPGRFDFFGSSHQIWHLFTIAAALSQLWACISSLNYKQDHPCE
jgi:adiponectin receptor